MTVRTAASRSGSAASPGNSNEIPASRILRLARTRRWDIVASGTRNARAISAPVRPPTAWSVSATRASSASAGWQQVKSRLSRSSPTSARRSGRGSGSLSRSILATASPSSARSLSQLPSNISRSEVWRRRSRSITRLRATVNSHAAGDCGHAGGGPALERERERLLERVFGELEVPESPHERRQHLRAVFAKRLLGGAPGRVLPGWWHP